VITVDLSLQLGAAQQEVSVSAEAAPLEVTRSSTAAIINEGTKLGPYDREPPSSNFIVSVLVLLVAFISTSLEL
jgi:hypothetical protein